MAAAAPSPLDTANANSHVLVKFLNMSEAEWTALGGEERKRKWWAYLGIGKPAAVQGNVAGKLSTLRNVFTNPLISRTGVLWMKHLLDGKVQCSACCSQNLREGVLECSTESVGRHLKLSAHMDMVKTLEGSRKRRLDQMDAGVQPAATLAAERSAAHIAAALVVGSFSQGLWR
jgi:hypothetical protein